MYQNFVIEKKKCIEKFKQKNESEEESFVNGMCQRRHFYTHIDKP